MYIPPFTAGVLSTIFVEAVSLLIWAVIYAKNHK